MKAERVTLPISDPTRLLILRLLFLYLNFMRRHTFEYFTSGLRGISAVAFVTFCVYLAYFWEMR